MKRKEITSNRVNQMVLINKILVKIDLALGHKSFEKCKETIENMKYLVNELKNQI